ncbi:hypothetical protein [Bradyrhizobium vignae]|uniref:ATP-dependent DNA ligase family profile domain-containing protein n=1 Tax=Bradyrhizobium vignae TaxID=1549949 RepID=A0A2U3PVT4_9BRAD|nr:protein of unknown function [Bradyrhizobium vignae]
MRLLSRNGSDWTRRYPWIAEATLKNRQKHFVIDGEAVILGVDGISDFNALHSRKHDPEVQLYDFDILAMASDDLRSLPLHMRKAKLEKLLARRPDGISVAPFECGEIGPDLFRAACRMGLEGLVIAIAPTRTEVIPRWGESYSIGPADATQVRLPRPEPRRSARSARRLHLSIWRASSTMIISENLSVLPLGRGRGGHTRPCSEVKARQLASPGGPSLTLRPVKPAEECEVDHIASQKGCGTLPSHRGWLHISLRPFHPVYFDHRAGRSSPPAAAFVLTGAPPDR